MDKKKILIVSHEGNGFVEPCRKALRRLGYELDYFDYRTGLYFTSKLARKLYRTIPGAKRFFKIQNSAKFLKKVKASRPDYIFSLKAETILPETIEKVRKMGIKTMNWYSDYIWQWDANVTLAPAYDFFFSQDPYILRLLKKEGMNNCYYLPSAADLPEDNPDPFLNRVNKYDIAMIATYSQKWYAERAKYAEAVKDLGLNIWGPSGWAESPLKNCYRGTMTSDKVFDIYKQSRVVPNVHYNKEPADGVSLRPFEAAGSGAMLICDDGRKDIFNIFKDGEEFVSFHDGDARDFRNKVKYYLEHEDERIRIAKNGYAKVMTAHTYNVRMKQMMNIVDGHTNIDKT